MFQFRGRPDPCGLTGVSRLIILLRPSKRGRSDPGTFHEFAKWRPPDSCIWIPGDGAQQPGSEEVLLACHVRIGGCRSVRENPFYGFARQSVDRIRQELVSEL